MKSKKIIHIEAAIDFIENHLNEKLGLETVAEAVHYSKYHLHRMFTETVGMTIHDYISRRQLTEAAKLLVFGEKSIMEIAFSCGYESQQAFTSVFKMMYKLPPAQYREHGQFYPLQLKFTLHRKAENIKFALEDIRLADMADIPAWMELVKMVIDGYPHLKEEEYLDKLKCSIEKREALILMFEGIAVGIMAFSYESGSIEFIGVHLQYRSCGISRLFLDKLMKEYLPGRVISTTTYRENDKADTGYRNELKKLGFAERELLMEFGYPTQRFVLPIKE
ncbi:MAG: helix-turn-helix transcriptional regulator [Anaerostipes sp.]|uniref:helix-turn-helix transcriptional regulator n=1 Tax=Anaerostipes sp. TaxID=1872530 RepID=UPI0039942AE8